MVIEETLTSIVNNSHALKQSPFMFPSLDKGMTDAQKPRSNKKCKLSPSPSQCMSLSAIGSSYSLGDLTKNEKANNSLIKKLQIFVKNLDEEIRRQWLDNSISVEVDVEILVDDLKTVVADFDTSSLLVRVAYLSKKGMKHEFCHLVSEKAMGPFLEIMHHLVQKQKYDAVTFHLIPSTSATNGDNGEKQTMCTIECDWRKRDNTSVAATFCGREDIMLVDSIWNPKCRAEVNGGGGS